VLHWERRIQPSSPLRYLLAALYAERQAFIVAQATCRLAGLVEIRPQECGMYLTAWLPPYWSDIDTAAALATADVNTLPLSSLTLARRRPPGLVLGYTGHSEAAMASAIERMARRLETPTGLVNRSELALSGDQ
jgi:DNA-binding transcriptional MocR family regulator